MFITVYKKEVQVGKIQFVRLSKEVEQVVQSKVKQVHLDIEISTRIKNLQKREFRRLQRKKNLFSVSNESTF